MASDDRSRLTVPELEQILRQARPNAILVPPRILRRVLREHRQLPGLGIHLPHRKSYVIDREALLAIAEPGELGLNPAAIPPVLLLLPEPTPAKLSATSRAVTLVTYWRRLFHCGIHEHLAQRGPLPPELLLRVIERIGHVEFEEIRLVLQQEGYLFPAADTGEILLEFAAVYLELRYFASSWIPLYFPAILDHGLVEEVLSELVDHAGIYEASRLEGAPDPRSLVVTEDVKGWTRTLVPRPPHPTGRLALRFLKRLIRKAESAAAKGNQVRGAILLTRAAGLAAEPRASELTRKAAAHIGELVDRLQLALELTQSEAARWRETLPGLLDRTAEGFWTAEARLLYDLQKVCIDHEREIQTMDFVEWAMTLGGSPLRRRLPCQREVLICKHVRSAARRLPAVRLTDGERYHLTQLLHDAEIQAEENLRRRFRLRIARSFEAVGLTPKNLVEKVAFEKLIEDLLDKITQTGYLTIGILRDQIARNQLKLPNLGGVHEFFFGDQLLRLDRELTRSLEGVHRRGEFYLRWLHRFSALNFGTTIGRLLTKYAFLPFGTAFVALEGLQHLTIEPYEKLTHQPTHIHLMTPTSVVLFGCFLFGLFHFPRFRGVVGKGFTLLGRGLKAVLFDLPTWLARQPLLRRLRESRAFLLFYRYGFKPVLYTTIAWAVLYLFDIHAETSPLALAALFFTTSLIMNSRWGRNVEERALDVSLTAWHRVRIGVFLGLYRLVMEVSKSLIETIERFLYAVDESLRFRQGENKSIAFVKHILGILWFFITYIVRFLVNLILEPQINPIKHFPVVTVSHKLLLPLIPTLAGILSATMEKEAAYTVATAFITSIPGIFGFFVWELKENWRLYEANRPAHLTRANIGHHGETILRFMRPGFHSGTLPKTYRRLRRAVRRGNLRALRKYRAELHHIEETLAHFVDRELVRLLDHAASWHQLRIEVGRVDTATNRIRIELVCPERRGGPALMVLEEQAGLVVANLAAPGWVDSLTSDESDTLVTAFAGLYRLAGVDVTREQASSFFAPADLRFAFTPDGMVVWPPGQRHQWAVYPMRDRRHSRPYVPTRFFPVPLPPLEVDRLMLRGRPLAWTDWVAAWDEATGSAADRAALVDGYRFLPVENLNSVDLDDFPAPSWR